MEQYTKNSRKIIRSAVNKLVDFVEPTYGPNGKKVIIDSIHTVNPLDDGVSVARAFKLKNPFEQTVVKLIRQVAIKTSDRAKDGTTGSLIILRALINYFNWFRRFFYNSDNLKKAVKEVKQQLLEKVTKITTVKELESVAFISYNNEEMSEIIADTIFKIGPDGIITIEGGEGFETKTKIVEGIQFNNGYLSPAMITNSERQETVYENPTIFLVDKKLSTINDILPILEKIITDKAKALIIAEDIESDALETIVKNRLRGTLDIVAVKIPFGIDKMDFLNDIKSVIGGEINQATTACQKIIVTRNSTTLIGGEKPTERILQLKEQLKNTENQIEKKKLQERIARLSSGIAIIKIGANTEAEMKAIKAKVENSVNTTQLAFKNGVVDGAGRTLMKIKTCNKALNKALKQPNKILLKRGGLSDNVFDSVDVLIAGIESAVSIADILLTSKGIFKEE